MDIFKNTYLNLINDYNVGLLGTDESNEGYLNISPMLFQNLIFEAVIQQYLYPIPKEILNYICSITRTKFKNSFKISYIKLYELLKNNNYKDVQLFKQTLKILSVFESGYLQIGVCSDTYEDFLQYFKSNEMDDNRLYNFYQSCINDVSGNTFGGNPLLMAKFKNACIFLNINHIKPNSTWKDTLSHELTHFIQRVVSFNNIQTFGKIERNNIKDPITGLQYISTDIKVQNIFNNFFNKLFNNTNLKYSYLASLYKNTLYYREESTTIQNILNGFQRMYEQQNIKNDKPNYKHLETNHNNELYQTQRLDWLNNILSKINDINYFNNDGKWVIDQFMSSPTQKLKSPWKYQQPFKNSIIILQYIGVKYLLPQYNIDKRLKEYFKTFKFRDN